MDDIVIARALHVLSIVHWIGGLAFVTAVLLPAVARLAEPARRIATFEEIETRFSRQAKFSVTLAGATGLYMTYRLDAWDRFHMLQSWWMTAMFVIWLLFTLILFIAEPLVLHGWFRSRALRDPDGTLRFVQRAHWLLLIASAVTIAGAVLGAHGMVF